jgi:hypothetical protein
MPSQHVHCGGRGSVLIGCVAFCSTTPSHSSEQLIDATKEAQPAGENVHSLWSAIFLAEEMGESLG